MNFLLNNAWAIWLGVGTAFLGITVDTWQFWALCGPLWVLVNLKDLVD